MQHSRNHPLVIAACAHTHGPPSGGLRDMNLMGYRSEIESTFLDKYSSLDALRLC